MAPPKLTDRETPAVVTNGATAPLRASQLPPKLRFPILLLLNLFLNSTLWTIVVNFIGPELGEVSNSDADSLHVFAHIAYRVGVLYFTWKANYDWIDVGALTILTSTPFAYLLNTYYDISKLTVAASVTINCVSIALPTFLLRARSPLHNPNASLRNRFLLESFQVQTSAALLAVGVYATVIWCSLQTGWLNVFLVTHFDIPTLEGAHRESPLSLAVKVLGTGIAARTFLMNPSIGAQPASGSVTPVEEFDPATASLSQTVEHNLGFRGRRTKTLLRQTVVSSAFILANTFQRTMSLRGSDATGAVSYAAVWIVANWVIAGWWTWVGDTET